MWGTSQDFRFQTDYYKSPAATLHLYFGRQSVPWSGGESKNEEVEQTGPGHQPGLGNERFRRTLASWVSVAALQDGELMGRSSCNSGRSWAADQC